jgi:hypothetical protein
MQYYTEEFPNMEMRVESKNIVQKLISIFKINKQVIVDQ